MFEQITLQWEGRDYVIPADQIMGAIAVIEEQVSFPELAQSLQTGRLAISKLAGAYAALLRFAGASKISQEIVYGRMFSDGHMREEIPKAVSTLILIMTPPSVLTGDKTQSEDAAATPGKEKAATKKRSVSRYTRR